MKDETGMTEIDLTGVHPTRWAEIQRRIDTIVSYLAIPNRTYVDEAEHALRLGLSPGMFGRLVAAWLKHGDPAKLPGAKTTRGRYVTPQGSLGAEVFAIVDAAIQAADPSTTATEVWKAIEAQCQSAGLKAPSRQAIWARMSARRSEADGPGIIVDSCIVDIPVVGMPRYPTLGLCVSPTGFVIAHRLIVGAPDAKLAASLIRDLLGHATSGAKVPLLMGLGVGPAWDELDSILARSGVNRIGETVTRHNRAGLISTRFGNRLGGIPLRFRAPSLARPPSTKTSQSQTPQSLAAIQDLVNAAILQHNDQTKDRRIDPICSLNGVNLIRQAINASPNLQS